MAKSSGGVSGTAVLVASVGGIMLWSGLSGKTVSKTLRDLIAGKPLNINAADTSSMASLNQLLVQNPTAAAGGASASGATATANKAVAAPLATALGWGPGTKNWQALDWLWTKESGWSNTARNPTSGAYGIPQALPPTKMPVLAQAPISDPLTQIMWGLGYIKGRYGNPVNAWAHEQANNWY